MPGLLQTLFRRRRIFPMVSPLWPEECRHGEPSHQNQSERQHRTRAPRPFARSFTYGDAPLGAEKIYAVREMPRRGNDPDQIKHPGPPVLKLCLHLVKGCIGMREQVCAGEAHRVRMPEDVDEGNCAGPALRGIHEISRPGIVAYVGFAAEPDVKAV